MSTENEITIAEIEKLKRINIGLVAQDRGLREEIERLKTEVRENTSVMFAMGSTIESRNVLIAELADALEEEQSCAGYWLNRSELIKRAREVVGKPKL